MLASDNNYYLYYERHCKVAHEIIIMFLYGRNLFLYKLFRKFIKKSYN